VRLSEQPEFITKERRVNSIEARLSATQELLMHFPISGISAGLASQVGLPDL
jgi:hypothetical protein